MGIQGIKFIKACLENRMPSLSLPFFNTILRQKFPWFKYISIIELSCLVYETLGVLDLQMESNPTTALKFNNDNVVKSL